MATDKSQLTDEEIYNMLKDLPDFDRLPLPKYFYEKFNIPPPKILLPMEAIKLAEKTACMPGFQYQPLEIREPAPGGVRPLIEVEPVKIEVKPNITLENALETLEDSKSEGRETQTEGDLPK